MSHNHEKQIEALRRQIERERQRAEYWRTTANRFLLQRNQARAALVELRRYANNIGLSLIGFKTHKQRELANAND